MEFTSPADGTALGCSKKQTDCPNNVEMKIYLAVNGTSIHQKVHCLLSDPAYLPSKITTKIKILL
jgi:hypothetical protein